MHVVPPHLASPPIGERNLKSCPLHCAVPSIRARSTALMAGRRASAAVMSARCSRRPSNRLPIVERIHRAVDDAQVRECPRGANHRRQARQAARLVGHRDLEVRYRRGGASLTESQPTSSALGARRSCERGAVDRVDGDALAVVMMTTLRSPGQRMRRVRNAQPCRGSSRGWRSVAFFIAAGPRPPSPCCAPARSARRSRRRSCRLHQAR